MKRRIGMLPFVDVFLLLLIVVLALVNPPHEDGKITPKAKAMLTMEWHEDNTSDVDVWIRSPNGGIVNFISKDHGHMILKRDDLGHSNDKYKNNGDIIQIKQNIEVVDFVDLLDGTYVVNAHMYNLRDNGPTEVQIKLIQLEPFATAADETFVFITNKSENTFFTFTVKDNKIIDLDTEADVRLRR